MYFLYRALLCCALLTGCVKVPTVVAVVETEPVASTDDAADDPAIWVHPRDPSRSLVFATDKKHGIEVYSLDGERVQSLPVGHVNNIDIRQKIEWGEKRIDVAVATNRSTNSLTVLLIETNSGRAVVSEEDSIQLDFETPYGICLYRPKADSTLHAFVNDKDGRYEQWHLAPTQGSRRVGKFRTTSQPEGCVADDEQDVLYYGVEERGLYRREIDEGLTSTPALLAGVGQGHLVADVEGIALYKTGADAGFVIVSSQGNSRYVVFRREGMNELVGSFRITSDSRIDGTSETDGIDATHLVTTVRFPKGLFVAQDGANTQPTANQNFKLVSWADIERAIQ
ncbi:MAG: phytase [Gammaproteobacteria bacterium]|nr:phytase [Gammaproteobacteria bacterium]